MVNVPPGIHIMPDVGGSAAWRSAVSARVLLNTLRIGLVPGRRTGCRRVPIESTGTDIRARAQASFARRPDSGRMAQSWCAPHWTLEQPEAGTTHRAECRVDGPGRAMPNVYHLDHTATLLMRSDGAMLNSTRWPGLTTKPSVMYTVLLPMGSTRSWKVPSGA
jgi:hypothetical protein